MQYIEAEKCVVISLGKQGENRILTVQFPISGWEDEFGSGAFQLLHKRSMDDVPYPCPIEVADGYVTWVVRNSDTAYAGRGQAQLVYVVNGAVAKSIIYETYVQKAIGGDGDFPEPYEEVLTNILEEAEYIHEHLNDADQGAEDAEAYAVGTRNGTPVEEDDVTYQNNSKYYAEHTEGIITEATQQAVQEATEQAENSAKEAEAWAVGQRDGVDVESTDETHNNNSKYYAGLSSENGEAWAIGKRNGVDVSSDSEQYHNNAKYYSEQSANSANESSVRASNALDSQRAAAQSATQAASFVGSPLTASTASAMTDTSRIYVYVGSQSGYNNGHWYYHNGTAWADGGVYNSIADDVATHADLISALYS